MYPIGPWDPFIRFDPFRLLERFASQWQAAAVPAVEVEQCDGELVLRVEVPGISPEDLNVTADGNLLTIRGTWRGGLDPSPAGEVTYTERRQGTFQRTLSMPAGVDLARATARYHHGVLEIHVPYSDGQRGRSIKIELS